jgi:histidyl-tRNA synthetase
VLVAVIDEASRGVSEGVAQALRSRGIPCEVAPKADKFGKQIRHADRRGIPYVWFPDGGGHSVKDIRSGEQDPADPVTWNPSPEDLHPTVISTIPQEDTP